ncbi:alkaline phosphatase family protein [Desulfatiglans anilini]|uniref:alkaline phosphatase family protein n=1 Tax=Desulfatiglans anilini TaxID=90728 RepID=UPI0004225E17|nr:alkaline phosphatase family protein [Desulfatiglans anilini]
MKIVLVLLDGLGDRSYPSLQDRTPLQAAQTPNLDRLAALGSNGLFHASCPGECLPSEIAHHLIFGYAREAFPGRGLLEGVGASVPFQDQDVLCLAHLSHVRLVDGIPILTVSHKTIDLDPEERNALYAALSPYESGPIRIELHRTYGNNGILVLKGPVSPFVSDSDPMLRGCSMARIHPLADNPEPERAERTARALNDYLRHCHAVLSRHPINRGRLASGRAPANFLATQRSGRRIRQEPFPQKWGMTARLIGSGAVFAGLAHELGLDFTPEKDTAAPGEDLRRRVRMALDDGFHDFIHVHTKAPDEAAHRGDPLAKKRIIQDLDGALSEALDAVTTRGDLLLAVTADHSTPCESRLIHSGEPVPVALAGQGVRRDAVVRFDEISAAAGCLGFLRGGELLLTLLNYADRSALVSHCLGPARRPFFPTDYAPFDIGNPPAAD